MKFVVALVAWVAGTGCVIGTNADPDLELDTLALERVPAYQGMAKVNAQAYQSDLGAFSINSYVVGDSAGYRKIHPEQTGSGVTLARGTMIVREVLDENRRVTKLTVMAKAPAGYDPSLGDWWFAVTDPGGTPLVDGGQELVGRLTQCHQCHLDRGNDDFLFGVPSADL